MKMGRLILVWSLVVVAVGCSKSDSGKRPEGGDQASSAVRGEPCEVTKVEKWDPDGAGENRKLPIAAGETAFVFGERKSMRARLHSHETRDYVIPLKELRNGQEPLFFGVAPAACWESFGGAALMCVRCRQNAVPPALYEPCCP